VFISYAHADEALRERLEKHLSSLQREGRISIWHDHQIVPGTNWAVAIDATINTATVILLLISPDFVASDYCYGIEMQRALERQQSGEACVIPVLLRPIDWQHLPFASLQSLPRNVRPVTTWANQDEALLDVAQGIRLALDRLFHPPHPLTSIDRTNRKRLLNRVRSIWIEGLLEHSLHQAVLIDLDLREQPNALHNPFRLEVLETDLPARPLPPGTSLVQVYDEAEGEVLLLGEPGSGKTTLLLNLAQTLLQRMQDHEQHPLPVIFPLTSWAQKRQPLASWLVEQLQTKYFVPRSIGQRWVTHGQILPLLDGLDEVAPDVRPACLEAINLFHQHYAGVPLVLCSRKSEYLQQPIRVQLQKAVVIQPLTEQQIETYFQAAHGKLEGVLHLLQRDTALRELAMTPLMLSILALSYQGTSIETEIPEASLEARRRQGFGIYITRMLTHRRSKLRTGTGDQIMDRLIWLAQQMKQHHLTEFYLEQLQSDWLPTKQAQTINALLIVLGGASFFGVFFGLVGTLISGLFSGVFFGLVGAFVGGLVGGLRVGLFFGKNQEIRQTEVVTFSWKRLWQPLVIVLVILLASRLVGVLAGMLIGVLIVGLVGALTGGQSGREINEQVRIWPNQGVVSAGWNGLRSGLVGGLFFGLTGPTGYATSVRKGGESPEKLAKATEMCLPERKRVKKGGEEDDRSCRPHPGGPDELAEHAIVVWRSGCGGPCTPAIRGPRSHPGAGAICARSDGQV
jgi:energy-coupling factor transporter ATP-binding protein EcfA2